MGALHFRIVEKPDPGVFDRGWIHVTSAPFVLDRSVWRAPEVSRSPGSCAALRYDARESVWELKNMAAGRVVILDDGRQRYDLRRGMAMTLWPGAWRGTLTEAFTFELTVAASAGRPVVPSGVDVPRETDDEETWTRTPVNRAREYLAVHWRKRMGLAYLWRQHLEHTTDSARDLDPAKVARAFSVSGSTVIGSTVTGWREELAQHVFRQRGHQQVIRDFVIDHEVVTRADVRDALRYLADLHRPVPDPEQ